MMLQMFIITGKNKIVNIKIQKKRLDNIKLLASFLLYKDYINIINMINKS